MIICSLPDYKCDDFRYFFETISTWVSHEESITDLFDDQFEEMRNNQRTFPGSPPSMNWWVFSFNPRINWSLSAPKVDENVFARSGSTRLMASFPFAAIVLMKPSKLKLPLLLSLSPSAALHTALRVEMQWVTAAIARSREQRKKNMIVFHREEGANVRHTVNCWEAMKVAISSLWIQRFSRIYVVLQHLLTKYKVAIIDG